MEHPMFKAALTLAAFITAASPALAGNTITLSGRPNIAPQVSVTPKIGSQSTGAGKVTFNPFSITRKIDKASPVFFH
jgi:hypothetical protein